MHPPSPTFESLTKADKDFLISALAALGALVRVPDYHGHSVTERRDLFEFAIRDAVAKAAKDNAAVTQETS